MPRKFQNNAPLEYFEPQAQIVSQGQRQGNPFQNQKAALIPQTQRVSRGQRQGNPFQNQNVPLIPKPTILARDSQVRNQSTREALGDYLQPPNVVSQHYQHPQQMKGFNMRLQKSANALMDIEANTRVIYHRGQAPATRKRTRAQAIFEKFTIEEKVFVKDVLNNTVGFINNEDRCRVEALFNFLDTNEDGCLQAEDFRSRNPQKNSLLQHAWAHILDQFDFNNDSVVEQSEFLGYFVIYALHNVQMQAIPVGSMAAQYKIWHENFMGVFREYLIHFEEEVKTLL